MSTVYVLNKDGKPLMPTTRCGHVRYLLKEKKARVVASKPFTIQLLYETDDVVQPLYLGIDPGRSNIGVAVVKSELKVVKPRKIFNNPVNTNTTCRPIPDYVSTVLRSFR